MSYILEAYYTDNTNDNEIKQALFKFNILSLNIKKIYETDIRSKNELFEFLKLVVEEKGTIIKITIYEKDRSNI